MRILLIILGLIFIFLQWRLWFSDGGLLEVDQLEDQINEYEFTNETLRNKNTVLEKEVLDLKSGDEIIERRAREDLGLIKNDEVFYQFVERTNSSKRTIDKLEDSQ